MKKKVSDMPLMKENDGNINICYPSGKCFWVHNLKHGARPKSQNDAWLNAVKTQLDKWWD